MAIGFISDIVCPGNFDLSLIFRNITCLGTPQTGFIDKRLQTVKPPTVLESLIGVKKIISYVQFFPGIFSICSSEYDIYLSSTNTSYNPIFK